MEKTEKQLALEFINLAAKGDSRKAFAEFVGEDFKHHNAFFKSDPNALMIAMEEEARKNPEHSLEVKQAWQCGNMVTVLSHVKRNIADPGVAVVHIFRFEDNKIQEFWDVAQAIPEQTINENGMF